MDQGWAVNGSIGTPTAAAASTNTDGKAGLGVLAAAIRASRCAVELNLLTVKDFPALVSAT
jgi:hypothetical protein